MILQQMKLLDESSFHHELSRSIGASIVIFSGPHCGACKRLEKHLPDWLAHEVANFYRVDVQRSTALAHAYEVFHLPSLFVFVDGRYHAPLHAEAAPAAMTMALRKLLSEPAQDEP